MTKPKTNLDLNQIALRARDVVMFRPDRDQRRAKSNFWSFFMGEGTLPPESCELATALRYGSDSRIPQWWDLEGFQDWFSNKDEFRQKVEYLAGIALDHMEAILYDEKARAGEKVAAIKLIMEIGSKLPKKSSKEEYLDAKIAEMDKLQLEEYIRKNIKYLPGTNPDSPSDEK